MSPHTTTHEDGGYILAYVMIAITLFVALASSVVRSAVRDVELSAQELTAVQAQAASDAAIECISYWARQPEFPFNTNTPAQPINCVMGGGSGGSFTTPTVPSATQCSPLVGENAWTQTIPTLSNGSYARVTVEVQPLLVDTLYPSTSPFCSIRIRAEGYDSTGTVSRTRWEDVGGWQSSGTRAAFRPNTYALRGPVFPTGATYNLQATVDTYAVLQVEVSGVSTTAHESNWVKVTATKVGSGIAPLGEVVGYKVVNTGGITGLQWEFNDGVDDTRFSAFNASSRLRVSIPGNTPTGVYSIAVQVYYGQDTFDEEWVYVNVVRSNQGQQ